MLKTISVFCATFCAMELVAWALHKYVMHGALWLLHRDHHQPVRNARIQRNDAFSLFFAIPSAAAIILGSRTANELLLAAGFGVLAYGVAYFCVHEVIIHRRWRLLRAPDNWYVEAINAGHKIHHSLTGKEGGTSFGMLLVPLKHFRRAWQRRARSAR